MGLETNMKLCLTEPDFSEFFFCLQNWENKPKMGQKQGLLNLLKNLVINSYSFCSLMKIRIICSILPQIQYLEKSCF